MKTTMTLMMAVILLGAVLPAWAADEEKKILYWVAPMDPNYKRDKPGKSPMGMDLIPVYEGAEEEGSSVTISPAVVQNLGIRTAVVEKGTFSRRIDTVGYIDYDESRVTHIHLRVAGWIEKLTVKSEGDRVRKGERLFNLYSPDLVNAQEEFVRALDSHNQRLVEASRDRLAALGISQGAIRQLQKSRKVQQTIAVYAPQDGVVSALAVREGMYVKPSMNVMTLADLSSVWLMAEVFERQAGWVKMGDPAEMRLPFLPGKTWQGRIEYIYPSLDPKTRTLMARLRFDNPDEALKPNMYARVILHSSPRKGVLSMPLEALIRTGDRDRVIVETGKGRFEAREVVVGIESGDRVEIIEGLEEGERVVTSGQFLIDSEASLKGSFHRMSEPAAEAAEAEAAPMQMKGVGVILALDGKQHKITLDHQAIPEMNWDAMKMTFDLDPGLKLDGYKPGDKVVFRFVRQGNTFVVTALKPRNGGGQP